MATVHSTVAHSRPRRRGDAVILRALSILNDRLREPGECFTSPGQVRAFLMLNLAEYEHEVFVALFLNSQHRLIEYQEMFRGTLTSTSVFPRELVKTALRLNAGAVIVAHNHPSCINEPSTADRALTNSLKDALAVVDVKLLDHFIVAGRSMPWSFAENGLL